MSDSHSPNVHEILEKLNIDSNVRVLPAFPMAPDLDAVIGY